MTRSSLIGLLQCVVFLAIVVLVPMLLSPPTANTRNTVGLSRRAAVDAIEQAQPEIVLVGNSMLDTRIDVDALMEVSGKRCYSLYRNGSGSAVWYLYLKNLLGGSAVTPQIVVVFFRDTALTWPELKVLRNGSAHLGALLQRKQPEFFQVLPHLQEAAGLRDTDRLFSALYPVAKGNSLARDRMSTWAMELTGFGVSKASRRTYMNALFGAGRLRAEAGLDFDEARAEKDPDRPRIFESSHQASFLPHMLDVAEEQGFKLCFYRVKRRPKTTGDRVDSRREIAYMRDMRNYIESHGGVLIDETTDPRLTLDWFADGDHIAEDKMPDYTQLFWARLDPLLP